MRGLYNAPTTDPTESDEQTPDGVVTNAPMVKCRTCWRYSYYAAVHDGQCSWCRDGL